MLTRWMIGGIYYKGDIIFAGEGQGDEVPSALYRMNPLPPYNTTSKCLSTILLKATC